ncbi:uncharacterized protein LOC141563111 [Sminthopsis crassicaudata]|uniref:uncharacterized protein LOC141563111 n=1 Tax=Sminthopsis crassicaudata TaxID=9301 RepID=UPI003D6890E6
MLPDLGEFLTSCPMGQPCTRKCPAGFYCPEGSEVPILCPAHTIGAAPGAKQKQDCRPCPPGCWCKAGDPATYPCPLGHYCPGGNESYLGVPQECPEHTYQPATGAQSRAECQPCPPGYLCSFPGLSTFEDYPCPPGYWCPGKQGALLCPPGTFRTDPGASSWEDCKLCSPGHYCPDPELTGLANVLEIPCRAGTECPAGAVSELMCRAGFYCRAQTGDPTPCPSGYICPEGSTTYTGPEQLCRFPYYCPLGSAHGLQCPGGSEPLNVSVLRVSAEACCQLCEAGTYRNLALITLSCQPCPAGFSCPPGSENYLRNPCPTGHYCPSMTPLPRPCPSGTFGNSTQAQQVKECHPCPAGTFNPLPGQTGCLPCASSSFSLPGASHCTCQGLNRAFQKSDGSCICLAGYVSYDERGQEHYDSNSDQDCQPQIEERCSLGDIRLSSTRKCVSPKQHNCSYFCHPASGELSAELGICQCREYVSAEELCDTLCLARAPQLSLKWGTNRELFLTFQDQIGGSTHREIENIVVPDQPIQGSKRIQLVQFGPDGIFGFIFSRIEVLDVFMMELELDLLLLKHHRNTPAPEQASFRKTYFSPRIPNPVVCLQIGDSILFQLNIISNNRQASHYPVYQKQHLFNSNPQWDFGAFRRLNHLIQETHLNFSRFAHVFLDPGTYVFQDNGLSESILIVLVKEEGMACGPGTSPIQPSSPYQLTRHGILKHQPLNLAPDWATITGVLLVIGLGTVVLTILAIVLKPSFSEVCPMKHWKPRWRSLGEPYIPPQYVLIRDSLPFYTAFNSGNTGEEPSTSEKDIFQGSGRPSLVKTLEDFSVRTLYDKLEDQNLHLASQLSKHRNDALVFYKGIDQQIQGLKEFLQELNQGLERSRKLKSEGKGKVKKGTEQSEEFPKSDVIDFLDGKWQHHLGCVPAASVFDFQMELDKAIAVLVNALSLSSWIADDDKSSNHVAQGSEQDADQSFSTSQQDAQQVAEKLPISSEECPEAGQEKTLEMTPTGKCQLYPQFPLGSRSQQNEDVPLYTEVPTKAGDTESPSFREQNTVTRDLDVIFPDLQSKIWQLEDVLDELNEEFVQLSTQALKLQTEAKEQGQETR